MVETVRSIISRLKEKGVRNVYSAFDGEPLRSKGEPAVFVGAGRFETLRPVYSEFTIYLPFRAEIEITVTAPESAPLTELCTYYEEHIRSAVEAIPELYSRPGTVVCRMDRNLGRMVLTAAYNTEGMKLIKREAQE